MGPTSEETTSSSVSLQGAVTPGNLRLEDAHKRLENDNITNTLSALSVESRTADMIRRLVYIRARLMKSSSRIEAKKQKIRAQRERRHIPGIVLKRQFSKKKFSKKLLKFVTDRLRTS